MKNPSYVLQALKILGPEEMSELSQLGHQENHLKKAAGAEFIVRDEADHKTSNKALKQDARVLEFPKIEPREPSVEHPKNKEEQPVSHILTADSMLWQRELSKQTGDKVHKLDAFRGYEKSTEMYIVKTPTDDGKDKIRFASTNGVLVNKKQD